MRPFLQPGRNAGFTLIELIVVMGLMAMLFGIGVGMLTALNPGKRAALGLVQNMLRSARNNAVARSAPARVRIDPSSGEIVAAGMDVLGTWQFETLGLEGSSGDDGVCMGGVLIDDGFLGKALSFQGAPAGAHGEVALQENPTFDLREGFMLECALKLENSDGGRALDIGLVAGLECRANGSLRAWFRPAVTSASGVVSGGGIVAVDSAPGVWRTGSWMRVEVTYDRRLLRLSLDGVEIARAQADDPVWKLQAPLVIGDPRMAFPGAIDALSIYAVVDSAKAVLPRTVSFAPDVPREIVFSADGALDRELFSAPLSIGLEYEDGAKARVVVNVYGTVE